MRARAAAALGAVLTGLLLAPGAPASATAEPEEVPSGTLTMQAAPGIHHTEMEAENGCHTFDPRMVNYADADPIGDYVFYSGPDCTGSALGAGRDETQWIPPLVGVRSVHLDFDG